MEIELITPIAMEKGLRFAIREGGDGRRRDHLRHC
jgi:translation elongation factor EF-Tu-like GTPase